MTSCNRSKFSREKQTWKRLITLPNFSSKARRPMGRREQQEWSIWLTQQLNYFSRLLTRSPNLIPEFLYGLLETELVYLLWTHHVFIPFHCLLWFSGQIFTLSPTLCLSVADVFLKAQGSNAALQWPLFKCLPLHTQISLRLSFPSHDGWIHLYLSAGTSPPHISLSFVISTSKFCAP